MCDTCGDKKQINFQLVADGEVLDSEVMPCPKCNAEPFMKQFVKYLKARKEKREKGDS
jgi:hypothetical protein